MSHKPQSSSPTPDGSFPAVPLFSNDQDTYQEQRQLAAIVTASEDAIFSKDLDGVITKGKRVLDALAQSEQRLHAALRAGNMGIWESDLRTRIVRWSEETACLFGLSPDRQEISVEEFVALVHPEDRSALLQSINDTITNRVFSEYVFRCVWPNGDVRWMQIQGRAIYDDEGQPLRLTGTQMDITERMALRQAESKARAADEAQGRVLEMIARGQPLETVLDAVVRLIEAQLPAALCSVLRLEGTTLRHGAAPSLPEAYCSLIDGITIGEGVGSCGTASYRKEPVIVSDIATDPLWAAFTGLARAHNLHACWSWPILAQDGIVLSTFAIYHHTPHSPSEAELACVRQATNLVGIALERHRREEALRQSEERFALAMEGARDGLWDWNIVTGETYFSARYKGILGYADHELPNNFDTWVTLVHPEDLPHAQNTIQAYFERQRDTYDVEFRMRHKDNSYRWILARGVALFNEAGQPYRMAGSHTDITEKKHYEHQLKAVNSGLADANAELEQQKAMLEAVNLHLEARATTDGLTRLKNHGAFQDRLCEEYERALRYQSTLSVVLLDVDKFKNFNDTHGHPAGDAVLKQVAAILQREARSTDVVARYGGEEFVVILPQTDAENARQAAERMREAVASALWEKQNVTASFGVSTLTLQMSTQAALVTEADKALYRSKSQGRNRVTHFTDPLEEDTLDTRTLASFNYLVQTVLTGQEEMLQSSSEEMRDLLLQSYDATITSWSRLLDLRDKETEGHSERVTEMMVRLTQHLGMSAEEVRFARWGALLHDIGKMAIPDAILRKPGPLTEGEWGVMRQHTTIAQEMLKPIHIMGPANEIPYCHHEKWDGSGYPRGLKEDEIPLLARLFAVVDVYDALCSDRPYRTAWSEEKACDYLREQAGLCFDPRAVESFFDMLHASKADAGLKPPTAKTRPAEKSPERLLFLNLALKGC